MASNPCEVTLELARSADTESPFSFRFAPQDYLLRLEDGRYRRAPFPWDAQVLADLAELEQPAPNPEAMQRLGNALRAFLTPLDWSLSEDRIQRALQAGQEVHLTLRFSAAELYSLPWELLTLESSGQHLSELAGCTFRYEWPGAQSGGLARTTGPSSARPLFAWSSAGGALPIASHLRALRSACEAGGVAFDAAKDVVENVSAQALSQALAERSSGPASVLHLLCHGARSGADTAGLMWHPSEAGAAPDFIDAGRLRQVLGPHAGALRMVVLCACQSGDGAAPGKHLGSIAQALHRAGIPAVIASRLPLSTKASILLTETLYAELMRSPSSVESALAKARSRLRQELPGFEWVSLQLYASPEGGGSVSFTPADVPGREEPPPRAPRRLMLALIALLVVAAVTTAALVLPRKGPSPATSPPPTSEPASGTPPESKVAATLRAVDALRQTDPTLALLVLREVAPAGAEPEWLRLATALLAEPVSQAILKADDVPLHTAIFSPDGKRVVAVSLGGAIRVWPADGKGAPVVLKEADADQAAVVVVPSVAFSPDGERVVAGLNDGTARVWPADGKGAPVVLRMPTGLRWVRFSPDGARIFTVSADGVRVWPADGRGQPLVLLEHGSRFAGDFSLDGKRVAIASQFGQVQVGATDGRGEPVTFDVRASNVTAVSISPEGKRLAAVSFGGRAEVWRANGQGEPLVLEPIDGFGGHITFSPDGSRIAAGSLSAVRVWRADVEAAPLVLKGHKASVASIAFSPDGRLLLTAGDTTARLWELEGGQALGVLRGHTEWLLEASFSPDGGRALTAAHDGSVRIWSLARPAEGSAQGLSVATALERLRRATPLCLEPAQRQQYLGEPPEQARAKHEACLHARP